MYKKNGVFCALKWINCDYIKKTGQKLYVISLNRTSGKISVFFLNLLKKNPNNDIILLDLRRLNNDK